MGAQWSVPYDGGVPPASRELSDLIMGLFVYVGWHTNVVVGIGRHVHVERVEYDAGDATKAAKGLSFDVPASERLRFKVLFAEHHMHVLAEHHNAFAEGWARAVAKAWKTEVSSP